MGRSTLSLRRVLTPPRPAFEDVVEARRAEDPAYSAVGRFVAVALALLALHCGASAGAKPVDGGPGEDGEIGSTDGGPGEDSGIGSADASAEAASDGGANDDAAVVLTAPQRAALQALSPATLPAAPPDVTNRFADDSRAAVLGQALFFDPSFSGPLLDTDNDGSSQSLGTAGQTGRVACAGCHIPANGFSDTRSFQLQISLGAGWGRRRAPSLLDVGQARLLMWDGRRDTLYDQIFGPLENVVEMNSSRMYMAEQIYRKYKASYEALFGAMPVLDDATQFAVLAATVTGCQPRNPSDPAPDCDGTYHGSPGDHAEYDSLTPAAKDAVTRVVVNAGKAIAAFERRLTCGPTPFDAWMHGGPALPASAQRGAALFVGRAQCATCHSGPFMSDQSFHDVGLVPIVVQQAFIDSNDPGAQRGVAQAIADPLNSRSTYSDGDDGRLPSATTPAMLGAFRTPGLRCVALRPTFMHTGQLQTLSDVVAFFNAGGSTQGFLGNSEIAPLGLSPLDQRDLVAFLQALTGPGASAPYLQAPPP